MLHASAITANSTQNLYSTIIYSCYSNTFREQRNKSWKSIPFVRHTYKAHCKCRKYSKLTAYRRAPAFVFLAECYECGQPKDRMGRTCGTQGTYEKYIDGFGEKTWKKQNPCKTWRQK